MGFVVGGIRMRAGSYNDNDPIFGPGFLNGKQTTNAKGLRRYAFEVKGGTHVDLVNRAFLDVWAKYLYVHMNGSTPEVQSKAAISVSVFFRLILRKPIRL